MDVQHLHRHCLCSLGGFSSSSLVTVGYSWLFRGGTSYSVTQWLFLPLSPFPEFTLTVGLAHKITFSIWLCLYKNDVEWTSGIFKGARQARGSSFKVPVHQSTAGFLWSSLGWGHRRTQEREKSLSTGGLPLFLVVMTLPAFLNSAHIFKSCYGSSMGLFSPLDCTGNHLNRFVCSARPHLLYTDTELHHLYVGYHLSFSFEVLIVQEQSLTIKLQQMLGKLQLESFASSQCYWNQTCWQCDTAGLSDITVWRWLRSKESCLVW